MNRGASMNTNDSIEKYNKILLERLSAYLNNMPRFIQKNMLNDIVEGCHVSVKYAYEVLLAAALGFDIDSNDQDREIFQDYFSQMIHPLNASTYKQNTYYHNIHITNEKIGDWEFAEETYEPFEAFVCNDLQKMEDGRIIPSIGFFSDKFSFPAVLEGGREWMLITPNEIETMRPAIEAAKGNILTFGLGMGYFPYMVAEKPSVNRTTIVEQDENAIRLFEQNILPQFSHPEKISIVHMDAFQYMKDRMPKENYQFVYTDLWHDPTDGIELYQRAKKLECRQDVCKYMYWIEPTIKCYL
jgi:hypothetical protein